MTTSPENHGLIDGKEYLLKIGASFQPNRASESYHTMRYDFKPASIDTSRPAEVQIGTNHECTVTFPNIHDSGTTKYKGGKKPCTKECVLIIDKETGEITLERISSNIPLKKSRADRSAESRKTNNLNLNKPVKPVEVATPVNASTTTATASTHVQQNSTSVQSKVTNFSPQQQPPSAVKGRETSTTSTSGSSSSDSSDYDSGDEANILEAFTTKAYEPPPPPAPSSPSTASIQATSEPKMPSGGGKFISTLLHSDLHLSDSNSDSD